MLNWLEYQELLLSRLSEMAQLSPDTVKDCQSLRSAGATAGRLDAKTREPIALACAVTLRCDGCIKVHTAAALKNGASREEVAEALGVAISVGAGATLIYSARVLDAWAAHSAEIKA
jgi:AhpD family alkylhydroperoxidase